MKEESDIDFPTFHCGLEKNAGDRIGGAQMDASLGENLDFTVIIVPGV